jgi:outer membrane protein TolC
MDEDVRRELDDLRRRIAELEATLARLAGAAPIDPLPPERDPLRHPQQPPPGDFPRFSSE